MALFGSVSLYKGFVGRPIVPDAVVERYRDQILALARTHGARDVRVFGSRARGDAGPESDLDLLVDLEPGYTLFDLGAFLMDVQEVLGCKVDVVTDRSLHWYSRGRVLAEALPL